MKTFLTISGTLLALALVLAVVLYLYLQVLIERNKAAALSNPDRGAAAAISPEASDVPSGESDAAAAAGAPSAQPSVATSVQAPIRLSTLPLSDTQKALAASAGIDVETFVITPEMIVCAEGKLGKARLDEIIKGASPTTRETITLLACL